MDEYIARLIACRFRVDNAIVVVNDFMRELDFDGLAAYVTETERLHGVAVCEFESV